MNNTKIKKNDIVVVISGKDRGKRGKVVDVLRAANRVVVEAVAMKKKHQRAKRAGQKGEAIMMPSPLHVSNVMLFCQHCGKGTRPSFSASSDNSEKLRICRKCKNKI